jgi:group I intron endonuclease
MGYCLYKITNIITEKIYIGVTTIKKWNSGYMGSGLAIKSAVTKYGVGNFDRSILQLFDNKIDAFEMERRIVTEDFVKKSNTYNIAVGGNGGNLGSDVSKRISAKLKGRVFTEEHKTKLKQNHSDVSGIKNPNYNSNTNYWTEEHIEAHKKRMMGSGNPMYGSDGVWKNKKRPDHSTKMKGVGNPNYGKYGEDHSASKSVIQLDKSGEIIKEWSSIRNASDILKIHASNISMCLKGKYKSAGGFIWKYK